MTIFYHIVENDPLDNGHGSEVIQGTPECTIEGHDGRMRNQAFLGHLAYCGVCRNSGQIAAGPGTPRDELRMYDATIQAREAVEGDIVLCECDLSPRLVAVHGRRSYIQDDSGAQLASDGGGAFTVTALAAEDVAAPSAGKPTLGDRRNKTERRCTLRIGVFFDGTGNNASNTRLFEQCKASSGSALDQSQAEQQAIAAHCKPYMLKEHSSYAGGYTNVWRLHQLYRESRDGDFQHNETDYFIPVYMEGIGTTAGKPDTLIPGYAFGTGETGVLERVKQAMSMVRDRVDGFGRKYPDIAIEAIEFDVFGFSRGAAAARHFVNEVNRTQQGPLAQKLPSTQATFASNLRMDHDVRVGFVGLFDTVVSYGSLADGFNVRAGDTGPLHVGLPAGCARQVVQVAARDEHRANFMLTTVTPQHREIKLPGVHSDVGGGYKATKEGPLMLIEPIHHDEPLASLNALRSDLSQSRAYREAEQLRLRWKERLGDIADNCLTVDAWLVVQHKQVDHRSVLKQAIPTVYATLRLERPIDPRYQLIALRVMHKLAIEADVALDDIDENDPAYRLSEDLKPIAARLIAGKPLDASEEALLARNYLHQSAHWNFGSDVTYLASGTSINLLYTNRPERDKDDKEPPRKVLPNI